MIGARSRYVVKVTVPRGGLLSILVQALLSSWVFSQLSDGHRLLALNRRFDILLGRAIRLGMGGIDSGSSHREFS